MVRRISRASALGLVLAAFAASCGGKTTGAPIVGSESHFLTRCSESCGGGFECIGGLCTDSCITGADDCSELHGSAVCTNQSVEPGQVAVCDVPCSGDAACVGLGSGFSCNGAFCRGPSAGDDPINCNPVGNYEVDETTPYIPCCAGLNELTTLRVVPSSPEALCRESRVRNYACIEGTCGDGVCEGPESPCGCGLDCSETPVRLPAEVCEPYLHDVPPPVVAGVTITNTSDVTLYVQSYTPGCAEAFNYEPALVRVSSIGPSDSGTELNIYGGGCVPTCQSVIENGWDGTSGPICPGQICPPTTPTWVPIPPGQSTFEPAKLEYSQENMPQGCAERIVTDALPCVARRIPTDGAYMITVVVAASADCDPGQGCFGQNFSRPVSNYFQENHTLEITAPAQ